ncbi:DUF2000 domain-containing protein [Mumia zhuanghuii]|uniref:DUF2000 family protein n=2 Tax=Mumia TaxID=1546255 RepID=A0ABW1QNB7_9ACTN|nr:MULTISPECIES: DUF2000 domain-containing protein [Mumia]KAA1423865.1 DUF2000 domain-containing protein [Mumia zhuanghuii]
MTTVMEPATRFDTKIAIVLRDDLLPWQELNVTAFLVSGIATRQDGLVGEPYEDGDGQRYLPMMRQPMLVFTADASVLRSAHAAALRRGMPMSIYTRDLFATGHDEANRAAVRAVGTDDLDLVGIAVHGPRNAVDKTVKGAHLHA